MNERAAFGCRPLSARRNGEQIQVSDAGHENGLMVTAYILGAGFSRAVSSSMPLLTELGLRVRDGDTEIANRVSAHEIEAFESWMSQVSTPQPYRDRAENLEAKVSICERLARSARSFATK